MHGKQVFLLALIVSYFCGYSQNLIPNPSFEEYTSCPRKFSTMLEPIKAKFWYSPSKGTPDLFSTCAPYSTVSVPKNFMGLAYPVEGSGYVGMYFRRSKNNTTNGYREYLTCPLLKTLEEGEEYVFSFYARPSSKSVIISDQLTYAFTADSVLVSHDDRIDDISYETIQVDSLNVVEGWYHVNIEFTAHGDESFLTIGDFIENGGGSFQERVISNPKMSIYYYFDHFVLRKKYEPEAYVIEEPFSLETIYFEFDSYELSDSSYFELQSLANYLLANAEYTIEIYGNTDEQGTNDYNDELSLKRANAVKTVLEYHYVPGMRIKTFGLGERNSNYAFDSLNRRTEFILVEEDYGL